MKRVIIKAQPDEHNTVMVFVVRYGDPKDRKNRGCTTGYLRISKAFEVYDRWVSEGKENVRINEEWIGGWV